MGDAIPCMAGYLYDLSCMHGLSLPFLLPYLQVGNLPTSSREWWHLPWWKKGEEKTLEGGLIWRQQAPLGQPPPKQKVLLGTFKQRPPPRKEVIFGTFRHYSGVIALAGKLTVRGSLYVWGNAACILELGMPVPRCPIYCKILRIHLPTHISG